MNVYKKGFIMTTTSKTGLKQRILLPKMLRHLIFISHELQLLEH